MADENTGSGAFSDLIGGLGSLFGTGTSGSGSTSGTASSVTEALAEFGKNFDSESVTESDREFDKKTGDRFVTESEDTTKDRSITGGITTDKLNIEQEALDKIISDVLSGPEGLASIFAGEQTAGIFDSSVAAQAAGDLASKLVGEIAKLTAERETSTGEVSISSGEETGTEAGVEAGFETGTESGIETSTETGTETGVQTQFQTTEQEQQSTSQQESESGGVLEGIGDFFGF